MRYYTCGQECKDRFEKFMLNIENTFVEKIKILNNKNSLKKIFVKKINNEMIFYLEIDNLDDTSQLEYWTNNKMNLLDDPDFKGYEIVIVIGSEKNWEERRFKHGWEEIKFD